MEFLCCKLQTYKLHSLALHVFKTPENSYAVKFLFTEAGARMFSTEQLFRADSSEAPRKSCKCEIEELHHECFTGKFPKKLEQLLFRNTNERVILKTLTVFLKNSNKYLKIDEQEIIEDRENSEGTEKCCLIKRGFVKFERFKMDWKTTESYFSITYI